MNATQVKNSIAKLLKGRNFAPALEGKLLWLTDAATAATVPLKAYQSKAGNIYWKIDSADPTQQIYVSLGKHYDDLSTYEEGDTLTAQVAVRDTNPEIGERDLQDMIDSPTLKGFNERTAQQFREAQENGYQSLIVLTYSE